MVKKIFFRDVFKFSDIVRIFLKSICLHMHSCAAQRQVVIKCFNNARKDKKQSTFFRISKKN